jgi:hypothetical protein
VSVKELLAELEGHVNKFRDELGHLVSWGKFERAGAVVTELEQELGTLGLPVAPVEALTEAVLGVAQCVHDHLTAGAVAQERDDIEAQIAELQAKLDTAPKTTTDDPPDDTPPPAVPDVTFKAPAAKKGAGDGGA